MFQKPFVVLDLETSGIEAKKDDIIEVAMIRYENGKEVARLDQLIKLDYELPKMITLITGITDKDLKEKGEEPKEVYPEIEKLLSGAYLIAHNSAFDSGFLKAKKIKMKIPGIIDTIPLAQIVFPQAVSYSLEALTDDLGIEHKNKHRAMSDAEATLDLFKKICEKIEVLPAPALQEIRQYLDGGTWEGGVIFQNIQGVSHSEKSKIEIRNSTIENENKIKNPLTPDEILKEGGILQQFWPDYEPRPQQLIMAQNVMNAFEQGYHLICEAPTGVGKSLAYLIAAAAIALRNKSKVVISTNTINLQDQLYEKDVPLLQSIYEHATGSKGIRAALLKGRRHYLCLRRFAKFKERRRFSEAELILLIKILVWQATSVTGDSGEIHLTREEYFIWDFELCSDSKHCTPRNCKPYGECYLHKARRLAEEADVVIVNHALLCADLEHEGGLLPDYHYLVVDEAHNFEGASTDAFSVILKQESFSLPLKVIQSHLETIKHRYFGTLFGPQAAMEQIDEVLGSITDLQSTIDNLFTLIAYFVNHHVQESTYVENLLVDSAILGTEEWMNLGLSAEETAAKISEWMRTLKRFSEAMLLNGQEGSDQDEWVAEITQEAEILQEQLMALAHFFKEEIGSEHIRWMASDPQGTVTLNLAPYVPGQRLKNLYDQKKSILLTSATLGIRLTRSDSGDPSPNPFNYLRTILSLDERFEELMIDSPFNFETQAYVLVPTDALPITALRSTQQFLPFFEQLIKNVKGSMLTLFTSYRMIETLYTELMEPLQRQGIRLLAQRVSGGRNKIMKAYLNDPAHSVLFGTASFWEGVDIKGKDLTTLVIHKLPFDVPSDPICKARCQMFSNGFAEYSLPRALLKFRQGFGRLIRSKKDYGVMVVLDNRLLTKDYGRFFLDSLPNPITIEKARLMDIPGQVKEWLGMNEACN